MTETYQDAKEQLDDIVAAVRKKDVSLERSLDLLEEGVALANRCTELIDQAAWESMADSDEAEAEAEPEVAVAQDSDLPELDDENAAEGVQSSDHQDEVEEAVEDESSSDDTNA
ncbi:MAG: exodeoxyribonuclease VII small subunit [Coriobacteriia bacterium]|nr:exodeoxyribonuclease VII small subunit [Coriobacteriia bacterium]MCL2536841.1 exodeoxyribonuclease VII small subunit [Coriobacteriia bacterium]